MHLKITTFLLFIFLAAACSQTNRREKTEREPTRGVWLTNVDSQALFSRQGIQAAVDRCHQLGFNTIYVVTWNRGLTLYPSQVMAERFGKPIDPRLAGRDPLRELIEMAHYKGLKVIAWFEFGFSSSYEEPDGGYILRTFPHWAARDSSGQVVSKNGFQWMNAFDPEVQEFISSLVREVVETYDVDGIQGDDRLPALPSTAGYDSLTVALYRQSHGGQAPPRDPYDPEWVDWRANLLNDYMEKLSHDLRALDPNLRISMAPSIYPWSKEQYLQDWPTWVREGWVDEVVPQVYRYDIEKYRSELQKIVEEQVSPQKRNILFPGILLKVGDYVAGAELLQQMVEENRKQGLNGEVFFFYEGLTHRPDFFDSLYKK